MSENRKDNSDPSSVSSSSSSSSSKPKEMMVPSPPSRLNISDSDEHHPRVPPPPAATNKVKTRTEDKIGQVHVKDVSNTNENESSSLPHATTTTTTTCSSSMLVAGVQNNKVLPEDYNAICRYCLCGTDETASSNNKDLLICPCNCRGFQKWVHHGCLRKWQRSIIVTQPTHPAFHTNDRRHRFCRVCQTEFKISPPSRAELMRELTGKELASIKSSMKIAGIISQVPFLPPLLDLLHWAFGVFFIFQIESHQAADGGDCIFAFNLTREILPNSELMCSHYYKIADSAIANLKNIFPDLTPDNDVKIRHFIGGPCEESRAIAVTLLLQTSAQDIRNRGGARRVLMDWNNDNDWGVPSGILVMGHPNEIVEDAYYETRDAYEANVTGARYPVPVHIYWGTATWSRTQLLGEIARGNWGMCKALPIDICRAQRLPLPTPTLQNKNTRSDLKHTDRHGASTSESTVTTTLVHLSSSAESNDKMTPNDSSKSLLDSSTESTAVSAPAAHIACNLSNEVVASESDATLVHDAKYLWQHMDDSERVIYAPLGEMTANISEDDDSETSEDEVTSDASIKYDMAQSDENMSASQRKKIQIRKEQERQKQDLLERAKKREAKKLSTLQEPEPEPGVESQANPATATATATAAPLIAAKASATTTTTTSATFFSTAVNTNVGGANDDVHDEVKRTKVSMTRKKRKQSSKSVHCSTDAQASNSSGKGQLSGTMQESEVQISDAWQEKEGQPPRNKKEKSSSSIVSSGREIFMQALGGSSHSNNACSTGESSMDTETGRHQSSRLGKK